MDVLNVKLSENVYKLINVDNPFRAKIINIKQKVENVIAIREDKN